MESQLAVSFGKVTDQERKYPGEEASGRLSASGKEASGIRGARALGQRVARALGRRVTRALGRRVARALGRRVARAFLGLITVLGWLALGPGPIGALGLGRLARGTELRPMVPTMPPFFLSGRVIVPGQNKKDKLDHHITGNSRPSMLLNFNVNFITFFETALDVIQLLELILRLEAAIKG